MKEFFKISQNEKQDGLNSSMIKPNGFHGSLRKTEISSQSDNIIFVRYYERSPGISRRNFPYAVCELFNKTIIATTSFDEGAISCWSISRYNSRCCTSFSWKIKISFDSTQNNSQSTKNPSPHYSSHPKFDSKTFQVEVDATKFFPIAIDW